jgi:hypothetical protein
VKKIMPGIIIGIFFITGFLLISGCNKKITYEAGFLEGIISIGPICPVVTDPPVSECLPTAETYKAYPVSVWTSDGKSRIAQIYPALDGSFRIELNPGKYLVILENGQIRIGSSNLPASITITSNNKTALDINIDTGIR